MIQSLRTELKLLLWTALIYLPFMGFRVLRSAGDDKLYVIQALEMFERNEWFVQYFQGSPNFYKGPFHYWSLLAGIHLFGFSMFATVWINFVLVAITVISLFRFAMREWRDEKRALELSAAFASCLGVYFYSFASQMESEIACLFTLIFLAWQRSSIGSSSLPFTILSGIIGWVKSPLYSVIAIFSGLLGYVFDGSIKRRIRTLSFWRDLMIGTAVGFVGYLPLALRSWTSFRDTYLYRETFFKGPNAGTWDEAWVGLIFAFLMPWSLRLITTRWNWKTDLVKQCAAFFIPSFLFFSLFSYKGQSYSMHLCGVGLILIFEMTQNSKLVKAVLIALAVLPATLAGLISYYFHADPAWWPAFVFPFVLIVTVLGVWRFPLTAFLIGISTLSVFLGERETHDLRHHPAHEFHYYSINYGIWNEWGYLNFMTDKKIRSINFEPELDSFIKQGGMLIVAGEHAKNALKGFLSARHIDWNSWVIKESKWARWKLRGADDQGNSYFSTAIKNRSLVPLENYFWLIETRPLQTFSD